MKFREAVMRMMGVLQLPLVLIPSIAGLLRTNLVVSRLTAFSKTCLRNLEIKNPEVPLMIARFLRSQENMTTKNLPKLRTLLVLNQASLQLEVLIVEKVCPAQENANLTRDNEYLHLLVEYHQANFVGMCSGFSSIHQGVHHFMASLQLEVLLAEKGCLAQENANLTRENEYLYQLVEYHQADFVGMCSNFSSIHQGVHHFMAVVVV